MFRPSIKQSSCRQSASSFSLCLCPGVGIWSGGGGGGDRCRLPPSSPQADTQPGGPSGPICPWSPSPLLPRHLWAADSVAEPARAQVLADTQQIGQWWGWGCYTVPNVSSGQVAETMLGNGILELKGLYLAMLIIFFFLTMPLT